MPTNINCGSTRILWQGKGNLPVAYTWKSMAAPMDALRIDRWLYFCRFFKSRSLATAAVAGGHVRINGERATPGQRVRVGDRIDVVRDRLPFSFAVIGIPARRGPAPEARACYVEDEDTVREREERASAMRQDRLMMPRTKGRPDKHTRRELIRRRGRS
jgi:ribosome-associated heat shock protein Hsp15